MQHRSGYIVTLIWGLMSIDFRREFAQTSGIEELRAKPSLGFRMLALTS